MRSGGMWRAPVSGVHADMTSDRWNDRTTAPTRPRRTERAPGDLQFAARRCGELCRVCAKSSYSSVAVAPSLPSSPSASSAVLNYLPPHKARSDSNELTAASVIDRSADLTVVDDGCGRDRPHAEINQYDASVSFFSAAVYNLLYGSHCSGVYSPKQSGLNPSPGPAMQINSPNKQQ